MTRTRCVWAPAVNEGVRNPLARPTERVEVRRIRIVAGHSAGVHVHNGPRFGSIIAGSVLYQIDGDPTNQLTAGDVFLEPQDARIAGFPAPYTVSGRPSRAAAFT